MAQRPTDCGLNPAQVDDINTAIAEVKRGEVLRNVIVF